MEWEKTFVQGSECAGVLGGMAPQKASLPTTRRPLCCLTAPSPSARSWKPLRGLHGPSALGQQGPSLA